MNLKISGQSTKTNYKNNDTSAGAVHYDEHDLQNFLGEALELGAQEKQMQFFDMEGHVVTAAEVIDKIDRHHLGLHKDEAKFYCIMLDPSDPEIAAMGADLTERLANGQQYVFDIMDAYAKNFHRNGIDDRHNLTAYAITNLYKGKEKKDQLHWHIIVAKKDASNKYKLSPLTNHRNTTKGVVKGGFDRIAFDKECERLFDEKFGYKRSVEESFDYCLAQKKGSPEQKAEQTRRLAEQRKPDLEAAVKSFLNHRVAQLAAEATARAIKEQQEQEDVAKMEAERLERTKKNTFWNTYNSHYKPLIDDAKEICSTSFELFDKNKALYKDCNQDISRQYDLLRSKYAEMDRLEADIQQASTAKGILTAVAAMITFVNPVLGIAVGLVGRIVAEANRSASLAAKKEIRAEAATVRDNIEALQEKQRQLRQEKTDTLRAYVEAKEARGEVFAELTSLREELLKPVEVEKPKIKFDFVTAMAQEPSVTESERKLANAPNIDLYGVMMKAADKQTLDRELLSSRVVIEPMLDRCGGVVDFRVTLAHEGREVNASSLVSSDKLRGMLNKWESLTQQIPAYKLAIERENREKLADTKIALPSEVKGEPSNGVYVIERDGKMAYADRELNIISKMYASLSPMRSFGIATNEAGQKMFIRPDGSELLKDWVDNIFRPGDGAAVIGKNGANGKEFNILDLTSGKLVSEQWSPYMGAMADGWAPFKARPCDGEENKGKWNYINKKGELLLTQGWADSATKFKNGRATITKGEMEYTLDKFGKAITAIVKAIIIKEKKNQMKIKR